MRERAAGETEEKEERRSRRQKSDDEIVMASCSTPIYFTSEKCQASKKRNKVVADRASSCVCIVASCQNAARPWEKECGGIQFDAASSYEWFGGGC